MGNLIDSGKIVIPNIEKRKSYKKERELLLEKYKECFICNNNLLHILEVHHIVPISCGGDNNLDNLCLLCPNCHSVIHTLFKIKNSEYGWHEFNNLLSENYTENEIKLIHNLFFKIINGKIKDFYNRYLKSIMNYVESNKLTNDENDSLIEISKNVKEWSKGWLDLLNKSVD